MKKKEKEIKDTKDLKDKTITELSSDLHTALQDQFKWRMRRGVGENPPPHELRKLRRKVARIKTKISEKRKVQ